MKTSRLVLILIIILSLPIVLLLKNHQRDDPNSWAVQRLEGLNQSTYARTLKIGKSAGGRPMYAVAITDPHGISSAAGRTRILFLSGQHGNEPTPALALLDLAESLADTQDKRDRAMLKRVVLVIVPVANPDGFSWGYRYNDHEVDINRCWETLGQPENRVISRLVADLRPHVIVDEHEGRPNCVEIPLYGTARQRRLTQLLAETASSRLSRQAADLPVRPNSGYLSRNLAHRHFAAKGICSMLLETVEGDDTARYRAYKDFSASLVRILANPPAGYVSRELRSVVRDNKHKFPALSSRYAAKPHSSHPLPYATFLFVFCGTALLHALAKPRRRRPRGRN